MNWNVPRTMIAMRTNDLFADKMFVYCRMDWLAGYGWWPNEVHPFWDTYQIEYTIPKEAQTA